MAPREEMADRSGSTRRRTIGPRKGDIREQEILDAAENLLAKLGYQDMTVNEIAEAAGITRGALYFYFASKQAVVTALVARTVQELRDKAQSTKTPPRPRASLPQPSTKPCNSGSITAWSCALQSTSHQPSLPSRIFGQVPQNSPSMPSPKYYCGWEYQPVPDHKMPPP
jgi:hypothetical protein